MKKFLILLSMLFCFTAFAQTETLNWYMDGNVYTTTQCESGNDILLPTTPTKRGYTFKGWAEYQPIEYLESTGTQWIDTGYVPNDRTRFYIDFLTNNCFGASDCYGAILGVHWNIYTLTTWSNSQFFYGTSPFYYPKIKSGIRGQVSFIGNTFTAFDGSITTISNKSVSSAYSIILFAERLGDDPAVVHGFLQGRIYSCKLYDNDILVRDFIPVLDGNGTPCMYDKVENKFYYNQGTGQFIAGPVIGE